jgi:hypothetical protein
MLVKKRSRLIAKSNPMRNLYFLPIMLLFAVRSLSQGSNCATAYPLILDGVCRTYNFSTTTEGSVGNCNYGGSGPVIYFRFTTGAADPAPCISVEANLSSTANLEAVLREYDCSIGDLNFNTVCFNDGSGYWALDHSYGAGEINSNHTYYLKFRVAPGFMGTITICARQDSPDNTTCQKATALTSTPTWYNNACHMGDTIVAGDVCANTLENTAWYVYTITGTDEDILNVTAINCDNFEWDYYGYQLGIFTGGCDNLQSFGPCFAELGGSLQFPLTSLPVGTEVHIAVDGRGSSNCRYMIWVGKGEVLPAKWGYLSGRPMSNGNIIKWSTLEEVNTKHFEIERSHDGSSSSFRNIGIVQSIGNSPREHEYSFLDANPLPVGYYRLKLLDDNGKFSYSKILRIEKQQVNTLQVLMQNPVLSMLNVTYDSRVNETGTITVINNLGQVMFKEKFVVKPGQQTYTRSVSNLNRGMYYLVSEFGIIKDTKPFIKQ